MIMDAPITKAYPFNAPVSAKRKLTSLDDFRTKGTAHPALIACYCLLHELIGEDSVTINALLVRNHHDSVPLMRYSIYGVRVCDELSADRPALCSHVLVSADGVVLWKST